MLCTGAWIAHVRVCDTLLHHVYYPSCHLELQGRTLCMEYATVCLRGGGLQPLYLPLCMVSEYSTGLDWKGGLGFLKGFCDIS